MMLTAIRISVSRAPMLFRSISHNPICSKSLHISNFRRNSFVYTPIVSQIRLFTTKPDDHHESKDTSMNGKLKKMWRKYGVITIVTYLSIYATTLSSLFISLDYGLFNASTVGVDPVEAIKKVSIYFL